MPAACVHPTVVSDAHRGADRLGDVSEQANGVRSVSNDPSRYAGFSKRAASLRPLLQLLQPFRLDGARPGPSGRRGRGRPTQSARTVVSGRRRHAAAQARQKRLRLGLVPRRGGLDSQAGGHRQRQPLGGGGLAICIPGTTKIYCLPIHAMLHLAGKNHKSEATLAKEMLRDILEWFPDRKLVFLGDGAYSTKQSARRSRPASDLRGRDAFRCGHLRSACRRSNPRASADRRRRRGLAFPIRRRP